MTSARRTLALAWIITAVGVLSACKSSDPNACPTSFRIGDPCAIESQRCTDPGSRCGTPCICENQPGALRWNCFPKSCACTCPQGFLIKTSCETLNCTKPEDPCPSSALDRCGVFDAGVDAGADGPRRDGPRRDGPRRDGAGDGPRRDAGKDATAADARRD